MKVIVCGDRNWTSIQKIREVFMSLPITQVIEGGARGADGMAADVAAEFGVPVKEFKAEWEKYGKAAGPIRNNKMLNEKPDLVIAFHNDLGKSKGTKNMIEQAKREGVKVQIFSEEEVKR